MAQFLFLFFVEESIAFMFTSIPDRSSMTISLKCLWTQAKPSRLVLRSKCNEGSNIEFTHENR